MNMIPPGLVQSGMDFSVAEEDCNDPNINSGRIKDLDRTKDILLGHGHGHGDMMSVNMVPVHQRNTSLKSTSTTTTTSTA